MSLLSETEWRQKKSLWKEFHTSGRRDDTGDGPARQRHSQCFQFRVGSLPPATKLRQGNVLTPVCDSVYRGGSVQEGLCPGGVSVSVQGETPPYGNVQVVRILPECIFVVFCFEFQKLIYNKWIKIFLLLLRLYFSISWNYTRFLAKSNIQGELSCRIMQTCGKTLFSR